jgi:hypothetical protein
MYAFNVCSVSGFTRPLTDVKQGTTGKFNPNAGEMVSPLYKLDFKDFWNHHLDNVRRTYLKTYELRIDISGLQCDQFPPADGDFLELYGSQS